MKTRKMNQMSQTYLMFGLQKKLKASKAEVCQVATANPVVVVVRNESATLSLKKREDDRPMQASTDMIYRTFRPCDVAQKDTIKDSEFRNCRSAPFRDIEEIVEREDAKASRLQYPTLKSCI